MRVLFLNYEYPPLGGGAANATEYLIREYTKLDIAVDLITSSPDNEKRELWLSENICVHAIPIGKNGQNLHHQSQKDLLVYSFKAYRFASKLLREKEYDVIHAFFGIPCGVLARGLGKKQSIPYIVSLRGADVPGYSERFFFLYSILTPLIHRVWRQSFQVVSNSQGLKDLALRSASEQEISIISNGVDTNKFHPDPSQVSQDEWIITAGATRLTARKGLHLIIEALPALIALNPKVIFEIMGDGASEARLKEMASSLGVLEHVRFLGRIASTETSRYYQKAKVFVLPSANEGMSNALLEAISSGLPAIVTDTGGSSELVTEGVNGYIIARSSEAIVEAVSKLIGDEEKRARMGEASRVRAEAQSWERVAEEYVEIYQKAVSQKI
jgi:glycosyltransferase involved in cell wall biosynthesis